MLYPPEFGNDPLFPQVEDFSIVFKDENAGQGVICYRFFEKGTVIAKIARNPVSDLRQHTLQLSKTLHNFDPYFSGYFLHSCDPNVSVDMEKMTVTALKDIEANSYIYMDYAETEDYLFRQFPCSCGADKCRSWITGRLELPYKKTVTRKMMGLQPKHIDRSIVAR
ncbi:SET domain-containing protein-lysine N-methyltransferase [Desulforhopalus sp. IMCC35007]|uniref:SET domain-containing protein-lysine N-methyltransferase n=1 Tax=Desulforhopalus sp. IMCC35007 TaxID=2569543 RepID=UPI0010AED25C|nr:SET domain-containing protein-lysine N-methyltransferase [Desulforhopalus sp. IMCC35007]TKB10679.1 SET domain-containing protein [Desulforhopalus sp. IMCC35007]